VEVLLVIAGIALVILIWVGTMSLDKNRIRDYVEGRGGRIVSISWAPFGRGWFGEKEERIFEVVYYDSDGNQHFATAKTSLFTGVFWTEDRVTHSKAGWYDSLPPHNERGNPLIAKMPRTPEDQGGDELQRLREENARLRKELEEKKGSP
jgi:hypothetical protein